MSDTDREAEVTTEPGEEAENGTYSEPRQYVVQYTDNARIGFRRLDVASQAQVQEKVRIAAADPYDHGVVVDNLEDRRLLKVACGHSQNLPVDVLYWASPKVGLVTVVQVGEVAPTVLRMPRSNPAQLTSYAGTQEGVPA